MSMVDELMDAAELERGEYTWDRFREAAQVVAAQRGEWAGSPMLSQSVPLVLEPRYPYQGLNGKCLDTLAGDVQGPEPADEWECVNSFWVERQAKSVYILHHRTTGKLGWFWAMDNGWPHRWDSMLKAMDPAQYMDIYAESRALRTLQGMVSVNAFRHYFLLGYFLETSKASGIIYLFRKLRPTLAMTPRTNGNVRVLTALCLHPIGYYDGTHVGAMVPTDDVLAHLLLMRGDEWKFWSKANHHPPHSWQAGI